MGRFGRAWSVLVGNSGEADRAPAPAREGGADIFLSHSHRDIVEVRRIRNALEQFGHNPLMFFLRGVNDDSELNGLIKREIEARTWFLLCDSPRARASRWVQQELQMIRALKGKVYEKIDLLGDWERQVSGILTLSRRSRVFISYHRWDAEIAAALHETLVAHGFDVWVDVEEIRPAARWVDVVSDGIDRSVDEGWLLALLAPHTFETTLVETEIRRALERRHSSVIPIVLRDWELTIGLFDKFGLEPATAIDFTTGDRDDNLLTLVEVLKTRPM